MAPDISIIVPTHNRSHLVGSAINSLLALRTVGLRPEVVVVNDGSTDDTAQVLQQFANEENIVIIESRHGERSKARNTGIARASAPFVGFLDDDDLCICQGYQHLLNRLRSDETISYAYGRSSFTDMSGSALSYQSKPELLDTDYTFFSLLTHGPQFTTGAILARRECLVSTKGFDETISLWEDWDLWLRLAAVGRSAFVDKTCAEIRDPGWDTMDPAWPQKLRVRARYCLTEPYLSLLRNSIDNTLLAAFYEQLACDAFTHRLYPLSKQAFQQWRLLASARAGSPKRLAQHIIATIYSRNSAESTTSAPIGREPAVSHVTRDERLAVVIPTYNRSGLVRRAVESVLAQTRPPDEVIVVNDGSTDDTSRVLAEYAQVRLINKPNGGLSSARNAGIEATSAEWIALLDDDDWYAPEMIERQYELLLREPDVDVVYTATHRVDESGKVSGRSHCGHRLPQNPLASLATENFLLPSAVRIRRALFIDAGMFDTSVRLCEDQDLWIRIASLDVRFAYIDQPLAFKTQHPSAMSADGEKMARATLAVLERQRACLESLRYADGRAWWLANAHYRLGRVYWEARSWAEALNEFAIATSYDPAHRGARLYGWSSKHPAATSAFLGARNLKRGVMSILHRLHLVEARWGS